MWVQKIDKHTYANEPLGTVTKDKFLGWLSATSNMGGSIVLKETSAGVRYLSIDFAGIHPLDDLQVKTIKFKKLDGSTYSYDYGTQGNLNITIDCIEVAYYLQLEPLYFENESAFDNKYVSFRDQIENADFQLQETSWAYSPVLHKQTMGDKFFLDDVNEYFYYWAVPGFYVSDKNIVGLQSFYTEDVTPGFSFRRSVKWPDGEIRSDADVPMGFAFAPYPTIKQSLKNITSGLSWVKKSDTSIQLTVHNTNTTSNILIDNLLPNDQVLLYLHKYIQGSLSGINLKYGRSWGGTVAGQYVQQWSSLCNIVLNFSPTSYSTIWNLWKDQSNIIDIRNPTSPPSLKTYQTKRPIITPLSFINSTGFNLPVGSVSASGGIQNVQWKTLKQVEITPEFIDSYRWPHAVRIQFPTWFKTLFESSDLYITYENEIGNTNTWRLNLLEKTLTWYSGDDPNIKWTLEFNENVSNSTVYKRYDYQTMSSKDDLVTLIFTESNTNDTDNIFPPQFFIQIAGQTGFDAEVVVWSEQKSE